MLLTQVLGAVLPTILSVRRSSCHTVLGVCDVISVHRVVKFGVLVLQRVSFSNVYGVPQIITLRVNVHKRRRAQEMWW